MQFAGLTGWTLTQPGRTNYAAYPKVRSHRNNEQGCALRLQTLSRLGVRARGHRPQSWDGVPTSHLDSG